MKKIILLTPFLLFVLSCGRENDQIKRLSIFPELKYFAPYNFSSDCNHDKEYHYCDNFDTAYIHAKSIESLHIRRKSYAFLSDSVTKFENLSELIIENQNVFDWEKSFGNLLKLKNLQKITIKYSSLKNFAGIELLKNLKELILADTIPIVFPDGICKINSLISLEIFCPIKKVAACIKNLHSLKKITIHSNLLKEFPIEILDFPKLEDLDISKTEISSIPKGIGNLKELKIIKLYETPLAIKELNFFKKNYKYNHLNFLIEKNPNCKILLTQPLP